MIKKVRDAFRTVLEEVLYGSKRSSARYIRYLQKQGVSIGGGTVFYEPLTNVIDTTSPRLLTIGENVRITRGVVILTHDFSWSVLAGVYGECLGGIAPVTIGNNVFIGMDAHIMKGVQIGDNVIIGAGSIVTKNCDSNSVYAGNPAKKIMTLEAFYQKKKDCYLSDAMIIAEKYRDSDLEELKSALREYCGLFSTAKSEQLIKLAKDTGYESFCLNSYLNTEPRFESFEDFLTFCRANTGRKDV